MGSLLWKSQLYDGSVLIGPWLLTDCVLALSPRQTSTYLWLCKQDVLFYAFLSPALLLLCLRDLMGGLEAIAWGVDWTLLAGI